MKTQRFGGQRNWTRVSPHSIDLHKLRAHPDKLSPNPLLYSEMNFLFAEIICRWDAAANGPPTQALD